MLVVEHRLMSPSESRAGTLVAVVFLAFVGICSGQQGLRGRVNDTSRVSIHSVRYFHNVL